MSRFIARHIRSLWTVVEEPSFRKVTIGTAVDVELGQHYHTNKVITSEFTLWNFLPKTLFRQLTRLANFYFLVIGIIQLALKDSPTNPLTSFVPLCCVIGLAIAKQGYEDWLRHCADKAVNKRPVNVIKNGKHESVCSEDVQVGDIIYVTANEIFPCDLILLCCDDPAGQCDVMTANLDGETYLKTRISAEPYMKCLSLEQIMRIKCVAECEKPVPYLYRFSGRLVAESPSAETPESVHPLGPEQLLPRGAQLRNTAWAYGCAVYLGQDTKMSMNFQKKKTKISRLERTLNRYLLFYVLGLIAVNVLLVLAKYVFARNSELPLLKLWGMAQNYVHLSQLIEDFLSFIALTNYVVPISLYVTIEMMKMISAYFFKWDMRMYDATRDLSAKANTSDLIENLGQIEHIFCDKTGTLTKNCMQFRYCSAGGRLFRDCEKSLREVSAHSRKLTCGMPIEPFSSLDDNKLVDNDLEYVLLIMSTCHSVRVECHQCSGVLSPENVDKCPHPVSTWNYLAASPDELAFLETCRNYGIVYCGRSASSFVVDFHGSKRVFSIFAEIPWSASRRKMSVVIKDKTTGLIYLLMKGADSNVAECCDVDEIAMATKRHVQLLSEDGYRVMACAYKILASEEASTAKAMFRRVNSCISFTERETMFSNAAEQFESGLRLIGAIAVEDKLQDGVADTLESFATCGIRRWVLTGDREETAVNVCRAAKLFTSKTNLLQLTEKTNISDCTAAIAQFTERLSQCSKTSEFGIVFDGRTLALMLQVYSNQLLALTTHPSVTAVLGCRLAPLQKAQVIALVRNSKHHPVCAAVGDGANDVSMILEADVGIAIFGSEGTSAARSSDYAVPCFSHLRRVFFVHGYYFYTRLAILVLYFFYKNLAFSAAQIYYVYLSLFSAQSVFESIHLTMYNVTFTSLPIFVYSLVEKSYSELQLLNDVSHYARLRRNSYMSAGQFFFWNFTAIFHSVVIFYGCLLTAYSPTLGGHDVALSDNGTLIGNYAFGQMTLAITLFVVLLKLAVYTRYWCWPQHAALLFTIVSYFCQLYVYDHWLCSDNFAFLRFECDISFIHVFQMPCFYFVAAALMLFALLPDLVCRVVLSIWSKSKAAGSLPTPVQELCSPSTSHSGPTPTTMRRPPSLISQNNDEWVELLENGRQVDLATPQNLANLES